MSLALGFVSGVLLATISFEMLPADLELSSLSLAVAGFLVGFAAVYELDLFINWAKLLRIVVVDINDKQLTTLEQA
jgi:ZIP family zinc transporter